MTGSRKILAIQRLRALAALTVAYVHLKSWNPTHYPQFPGSDYGVDLFFVISGYVVTQSLLGMPALRFYVRRFFRIVPLAVVSLAAILLGAYLIPDSPFGPFQPTWAGTLQVLSLRYNYYFIRHPETGNMVCYWTLMVEEHFYFLLPIFLWVFRSDRMRLLASFCGVLSIHLLIRPWIIGHLQPKIAGGHLHFGSECRFDELLLGVSLFFFRRSFPAWVARPVPRILGQALGWLLVFAILVFPEIEKNAWLHSETIPYMLLICGTLVYIASFDSQDIMGLPSCRKALEYLGDRSYAIYLIHIPMLELFDWIERIAHIDLHHWPLACALLYFCSVFVIAEICYQTVETRFISMGKKVAATRLGFTPT